MTKLPGKVWLCLAIVLVLLPAGGFAADEEHYLGPVAVAAVDDGKTLVVACADASQVAVVDVEGKRVVRRIDVPDRPTGVVAAGDGAKVIVTCAAAKSTVVVLDAASGELLAKIRVGHTAMGPAVSADGSRLYVCNRFDDDVSVIDLAAGKEIARLAVVREPVAAAVTPDGRAVLVGNHLPADRADRFYVAAAVTIIDAVTHRTTNVRLPNGANG
ncbi:MAG: cell surface protein, partial [Candidatus Nealsonbacteria bacterium]|nr:cell surface protein [Candidatus Nealsonbacteria bacterium]